MRGGRSLPLSPPPKTHSFWFWEPRDIYPTFKKTTRPRNSENTPYQRLAWVAVRHLAGTAVALGRFRPLPELIDFCSGNLGACPQPEKKHLCREIQKKTGTDDLRGWRSDKSLARRSVFAAFAPTKNSLFLVQVTHGHLPKQKNNIWDAKSRKKTGTDDLRGLAVRHVAGTAASLGRFRPLPTLIVSCSGNPWPAKSKKNFGAP